MNERYETWTDKDGNSHTEIVRDPIILPPPFRPAKKEVKKKEITYSWKEKRQKLYDLLKDCNNRNERNMVMNDIQTCDAFIKAGKGDEIGCRELVEEEE